MPSLDIYELYSITFSNVLPGDKQLEWNETVLEKDLSGFSSAAYLKACRPFIRHEFMVESFGYPQPVTSFHPTVNSVKALTSHRVKYTDSILQ